MPEHRVPPLMGALTGTNLSQKTADSPLYRCAFFPFVLVNSTGAPVGMAEGAMDAFLARVPGRKITYTDWVQTEAQSTHIQVADAAVNIRAAKVLSNDLATRIRDAADAGRSLSVAERAAMRAESAHVVRLSRWAVETLNSMSGASSIQMDVPIQRIFRADRGRTALAAGLLLPFGAGVAAATSPEPVCAAVVEAEGLVDERQDALDEALAAYNRQKTVMATTRATYERLQADETATAADIEDARVTAQRAVERNTKLFAAQQAAGRALQEAVRERADARERAEGVDCTDGGTDGVTDGGTDGMTDGGTDGDSTGAPVAPRVIQPVTVHQQTNIHPISVYLWSGERWVVYSDGTAVRCGSGGQDVQRVEVVNAGVEQGAPSSEDVADAAYPEGGVAAGDGSGAMTPILPVAAGAVGLTALGAGGVAWHRRRSTS
ncbi:hypothetical protein Acsp06_62960 [Actinomycetospora sp. NBRC 106375]|uniref:hypothetical protein n=1 Tax=Actinomycetospora sp. NBRC 106375 TaxID=3032207 RepID=UPI00249FD259|nr:hypothetical protein [Actinomycetospora sp. NBRC 106375]GLZ50111.1 hypothetical protein Acsp06_62960 [Actinomycetospora sp. NBRC 106375]